MIVRFLAFNAALIALLGLAPFAGGPGASATGDLARSLVTRWLPFAFALATILTATLAARSAHRADLLRSHWWIYLAAPVTAAIVRFGDAVGPGVLGIALVAIGVRIATTGLLELWRSREARSDRELGLLLGFVVLAVALALLPYDRSVQLTQSDEPHYLVIVQSLIGDHDLELRDEYDRADYADFYPGLLPDRHVIGVGTAQYPIRDLGLPIMSALPFAIARRTGVLVLMCLIGAVFAWRGYAFLRFHQFSRSAALPAAAATALLHPLFTYTTQIYPDLPAALIVLLVAELLARPATVLRFAAASALLGLLPWFTVRAWFVVVGMGIVVAWLALAPFRDGITRRRLALVAAGGLPFAVLLLALIRVELSMFGIPVPNAGYYLIREQGTILAFTPQIGIPGLFLDRTFGLLSHAPLFALAFFGAVPLLRRARALRSPGIVALFLGWLFYLAYIGDVQYWWADGSPSSRYQLATIAFPMLAVAAGLERPRGLAASFAVWAAALWSAGVTVIYAWLPNLRYDISGDVAPTGGPGELWLYVTRTFRADPGLLFPSLVRAAPVDLAFTLAWCAFLGGLVFLGSRGGSGRHAPTVKA